MADWVAMREGRMDGRTERDGEMDYCLDVSDNLPFKICLPMDLAHPYIHHPLMPTTNQIL